MATCGTCGFESADYKVFAAHSCRDEVRSLRLQNEDLCKTTMRQQEVINDGLAKERELKKKLEMVCDAWGHYWDCSRTPGHGPMHDAVEVCRAYLGQTEKQKGPFDDLRPIKFGPPGTIPFADAEKRKEGS